MRLPTPTPQRLQHCHVLHVAPRSSTSIGKIPTHPLQQQQRASRQPHRLTCTVSAASTPTSTPQHTVRFSLCYEARFGQQLRLVGSVPTAGSWKPSKSLPLTWTEGNEWVLDVKLSAGYEGVFASGASALFTSCVPDCLSYGSLTCCDASIAGAVCGGVCWCCF